MQKPDFEVETSIAACFLCFPIRPILAVSFLFNTPCYVVWNGNFQFWGMRISRFSIHLAILPLLHRGANPNTGNPDPSGVTT